MPQPNFLSDAEIHAVRDSLSRVDDRSLRDARNFHNAVHAFLNDLNDARGGVPVHRLLCVDATEVVSFARYTSSARKGFTFGSVIEPRDSDSDSLAQREKIRNIDRLITHHLLFGRQQGFVLLNPHVDELKAIRTAIDNTVDDLDSELYRHIFQGDLLSLSEVQFGRIAQWITQEAVNEDKEFETFRNTFLPGLRTSFVQHLYGNLTAKEYYRKFEKDGRYQFLARNTGPRSFLHSLNADIVFPWSDFLAYTKLPQTQDTFDEIVKSLSDLIASTPRIRPVSEAAVTLAANRDARALATIHVLNSFTRAKNIPIRTEFVTRASIIHSLSSAIPADRLDVTIRHPLLIPEIYAFDANALNTIGHVFQSVANALAPLASSIEGGSANNAEASKRYRKIEPFVRGAARQLLNALAGVMVIQQSLEQDNSKSMLDELIDETRADNPRAPKKKTLSKAILHVFDNIRSALSSQRDPFSMDAINAIADNNFKLIELERRQLDIKPHQYVEVRYVQIKPDSADFPVGFTAFRMTRGRIPRLFHVYSDVIPRIFVEEGSRAGATAPKTSRGIPISELFRRASDLLANRGANASKENDDSRIANLEFNLLACIAFASLGRYRTSVTLSSTVLNQFMRRLHVNETGIAKYMLSRFPSDMDARIPLVLKELFILRQYCERAIAREELDDRANGFGGTRYRGIQSFDNAEQDLHLALRMNEAAELLAKHSNDNVAPGGMVWFEDFRFTLISFYGWVDHYIAALVQERALESELLEQWSATAAQKLWVQHDRWTSAAWAREMQLYAFRIQRKRERTSDPEAKRYHAYAEFCTYQGLLTLVVTRLALEPSAEVQVFWNPYVQSTPERILAFSNWSDWRRRHMAIAQEYQFEVRLTPLYEAVFSALKEIDGLAVPHGEGRTRYHTILQTLREQIVIHRERLVADDDVTFTSILLDALVDHTIRLEKMSGWV